MKHDGEENHCTELTGSLMAPRIQGNKGVFKWSACSRNYLDTFLRFVYKITRVTYKIKCQGRDLVSGLTRLDNYSRSAQSWCLGDQPTSVSSLRFPDKLPGEMYDVTKQCQWQFDESAKFCDFDFAEVKV